MSKNEIEMYTNHMLCVDLEVGEICFRSFRYNDGEVAEIFHEHVPKHRIFKNSANEALRALVDQAARSPAVFVLHSRLNSRKGGPECYPGFTFNMSYPEPGVARQTFSGRNAWAWSDSVVLPELFRTDRVED